MAPHARHAVVLACLPLLAAAPPDELPPALRAIKQPEQCLGPEDDAEFAEQGRQSGYIQGYDEAGARSAAHAPASLCSRRGHTPRQSERDRCLITA